jgi:hypothetical protein
VVVRGRWRKRWWYLCGGVAWNERAARPRHLFGRRRAPTLAPPASDFLLVLLHLLPYLRACGSSHPCAGARAVVGTTSRVASCHVSCSFYRGSGRTAQFNGLYSDGLRPSPPHLSSIWSLRTKKISPMFDNPLIPIMISHIYYSKT